MGVNYELKQLEVFTVNSSNGMQYGYDQNNYPTKWQRMGGCGPTTAAMALKYLSVTNPSLNLPFIQEQPLEIMERTWKYITPRFQGVNSTKIYSLGITSLLNDMGIISSCDCLDIPKKKSLRPSDDIVIEYINSYLSKDIPIAFLNLHNANIDILESWHWVLIVAIENNDNQTIITIYEQGKCHRINLYEWLDNTKKGGGFAALQIIESKLT